MSNNNEFNQLEPILKWVKRIALWLLLIVIACISVFGSYFIVDSGEKGVVRRFGESIRVAEPGLGFKFPIVDNVVIVPTREMTYLYGSKRDGKVSTELSAYTRDQQGVNLMISVTFSVSDPIKLYNTYRSVEGMVDQVLSYRVSEQAEIAFGKYNIIESISKRDAISNDISLGVRKALENQPIEIKNVSLVELEYSDVYNQGVEKSMHEEINRQTAIRAQETAKIQADTAIIKQRGESDALLIKVNAEAESVRLRGQAEADAIKAKSEALEKQGHGLIQLTLAERWKGHLPTTMIPGSALPMLNINKLTESKPTETKVDKEK